MYSTAEEAALFTPLATWTREKKAKKKMLEEEKFKLNQQRYK